MIKLNGYYRSSASFRVRIALNLKNVPHEKVYYHLRKGEHLTPEYLAINPSGLMPSLDVDGEILTQSLAILEYLDDRFPDPPLLPADALGRARVRALAQLVVCDIHPIDNLRVLKYLRTELALPEDRVQAWYNHWIAVGFEGLEAMLGRGPTGRFCHGGTPTLADLCLVPQVINSRNFGLDLTPYPTIRRITQACLEMPEFETALPANQPDADPPA